MITREPAVAGQFYSANSEDLRKTIRSFARKPEMLLEAKAVLVPHAGYVYSGPVAGKVFASVRLPDRFVLLGPNHSGRGYALALSPAGNWRTPLGTVSVDSDMNRKLLAECPGLREDASAHRMEHALEVQIPFLQELHPDFQFSAICVGTAEYSVLEKLGHAMARVLESASAPILLVASSDMTHYESADTASRQDRFAIDRILEIDPAGLFRIIIERDITMCGYAPTVAVLVACRDLGGTAGHLIDYTNSGVASGDFDRVVAYAGIAVV
jgi:MEMO1 family protein